MLIIILFITSFACHSDDAKSVLLINSYHPQYMWTQDLTSGVQAALSEAILPENLYIEFMDARRFIDDPNYEKKIVALLQHKYQTYEPDLIITSDDYAYHFVLKHGESLFPDKPVIFSGVNVFDPNSLQGKKNYTGVLEGMEIQGNLDLILSIQPQVKRIILLGDTTGLGLKMVQEAKKIKQLWAHNDLNNNIELIIWDEFSLAELYKNVKDLAPDTAILMLAIHKDTLDQYFSFDKELPILSHLSPVPIYGMWGSLMIGNGVIGGLMNDPYLHGKNAANMALQVLNGVPVAQLPLRDKAKFQPVFDYEQLKRFDIDQNRLPSNSLLIGKPISTYQEHFLAINITIAVVLFLIFIISLLLTNIRQRIQAQSKLDKLNKQLEKTVDDRTKTLNERNRELESISQKMEFLAHTDSLTKLANRRAGTNVLSELVAQAIQNKSVLSIAILDLDLFKQINDLCGHQMGDEVLISVGEVLNSQLKNEDTCYRWGGEEFLIIFPGKARHDALEHSRQIKETISTISVPKLGRISASIGLAELSPNDTMDSLLARADLALYSAKDKGRNRIVSN